jgi:hypothetical protein
MIRKTYALGVAMKGGCWGMEGRSGDRVHLPGYLLRVITLNHPELKPRLNHPELKSPQGV